MAEEKILITLEADDNASQKIEAISKALRNMDKSANQSSGLSGAISSFEKGIGRINSVTRQYNHAMGTVNRLMINTVKDMGSAIYDFTSDSIDNFTKFSEQHARVLGVMRSDYDKTAESQAKFFEDAQKLKEQAMRLGTYGIDGAGSLMSVIEVSQAQESLIKAGVDKNDIINGKALEDILVFSQANEIGIDPAVNAAVTLGNQFNIPETEWASMLDKITYTANMSIVEVSDIVQSLKWASGVAAGLGRGGTMEGVDKLNEVLGMLTILGDFGLRGSQAGTGVQALLTRLLTGDTTVITQAQADVAPGNALEKFYDFEKKAKPDGNLLPMADVVGELNTVMSDMTDEEQAWFAKKLFGLYQMKAAYALINGEDVNLDDVIEEIEKQSGGTNREILYERLSAQAGKLEALNNLWEGIKTDFGDKLNPFVDAIATELFAFLRNDGNYDINFDNLKSALDESCNLIEEKYGTAISTAVRNIGEFTIDLTQVAQELGPEFAEGLSTMIGSLAEGDIFGDGGALSDWDTMIDNMYTSVDGLPEELQELGDSVVGVIDMFGNLAKLNIASTIIELISSALQIATVLGGMVVHATSVIVNGGVGGGTTPGGGTPVPTGNGKAPKGNNGKSVPSGTAKGSVSLGTADDVAKAIGTDVDDVINAIGKKSTYTIDDVAKGFEMTTDDVMSAFNLGTGIGDDVIKLSPLLKYSKVLGAAGTALQVGSTAHEAYGDFKSGDTKGGTEAIAGGAGSMVGSAAVAKLGGAIGTAIAPGIGTGIGIVAGAIIGALSGDAIGRNVSGAVYDAVTDSTKKSNNNNSLVPAPTPVPVPTMQVPGIKTPAFIKDTASTSVKSATPAPAPAPSNINANSVTVNSGSTNLAGEVKIPDISATFAKMFPQYRSAPFSDSTKQKMIENVINIDDTVTVNPQFNVAAPSVNVNVRVDQSGRVYKNTSTTGATTQFNNWFTRTSSQYGKGKK